MLRLQQKPGVLDMKNYLFEGLRLKTRIRRFNTVLVCMRNFSVSAFCISDHVHVFLCDVTGEC